MIRTIADNAAAVRSRVETAAHRVNRDPAAITIVAVSKTFPRSDMMAAYEAGFRVFGESRAQEIREKLAEPLPVGTELHMIGSLQTNKITQVLPHIDLLQTLDRTSLVRALANHLERRDSVLRVLMEVNVAGEAQKAGVSVADTPAMLADVLATNRLVPEGLMTMAPFGADEETLRRVFGGLRMLRDRLQEQSGVALPMLSMGMSDDFEIAIEEGATHVRLGRSLFGTR